MLIPLPYNILFKISHNNFTFCLKIIFLSQCQMYLYLQGIIAFNNTSYLYSNAFSLKVKMKLGTL